MEALLSPQILCPAAPVAAPVGHPSLAGAKAVPWLCARSGVCRFLLVFCFGVLFFFLNSTLFSGGDGLHWHGARGSPLLARKPDAWSHCLALPGKAGKASAGVIKQHAGAAGPEPPASEVPPHFVTEPCTASIPSTKQQHPCDGCCSSLEHPLLSSSSRHGFGARSSSSRMEKALSPALLPLRSLPPPPQQCCGESRASQSADCSDRWQVISPLANLTLEKKIGLGVIQLLGLKARG